MRGITEELRRRRSALPVSEKDTQLRLPWDEKCRRLNVTMGKGRLRRAEAAPDAAVESEFAA